MPDPQAPANQADEYVNETPPVPIFAIGRWKGREWTASDLDAMVSNFAALRPQFEPKLILGHDESEKVRKAAGLPALGVVRDLYREGKRLMARFAQVPRALVDLIKRKAYDDVSVGIYTSGFPDHPETKARGPILRHVGILGDEVAHLKVLDRPLAALAALGEGVELACVRLSEVEVSTRDGFQDDEDTLAGSPEGVLFVLGRLKDEEALTLQTVLFDRKRFGLPEAMAWLKDHELLDDKLDEAPNALRFRQRDPDDFQPASFRVIAPGARQESKEQSNDQRAGAAGHAEREEGAMPNEQGTPAPGNDEHMKAMMAQVAELTSKLAELTKALGDIKGENAELKKSAAKMQQEATEAKSSRVHAEVKRSIEDLKRDGRYLPVFDELGIPGLLAKAALAEEQPQVFAEGKAPTTTYGVLSAFLAAMPKLVEMGERAQAVGGGEDRPGAVGTDRSVALLEMTENFIASEKKAGRDVAFEQALRRVSKDHPELMQLA